jgi:hypothetical protein
MRDMFGTDSGAPSESATVDVPAATAPAPASTPAATTPAAGAPTLQQAVNKAVAKGDADKIVNANPDATHHVKLAPLSKPVIGATAAGAALGALVAGPVGAVVGAGVGFVQERYQVAGGLATRVIAKIKSFKGVGPSSPGTVAAATATASPTEETAAPNAKA